VLTIQELLMKTNAILRSVIFSCVTGLLCGCVYEQPPGRIPADQLSEDNGGLQSADVQAATDKMATELLALPKLNTSDRKWTIVVRDPVNQTTDPYTAQYNVFSNRLKSVLLAKSAGRIQLIDNKDAYHALQNSELETPAGSGQPAGIQPDYALTITINEMPNRAYSYFQVNGGLTSLNSREIYWSNTYEIQAAR
jgi:PBP1b-binding outer membrane lipoprotein LpoB